MSINADQGIEAIKGEIGRLRWRVISRTYERDLWAKRAAQMARDLTEQPGMANDASALAVLDLYEALMQEDPR